MKPIIDFILESFKINSNTVSKNKEDIYYDKSNYQDGIDNLKEIAKENGYIIKFRNRKMNSGDFCIFIYDENQPNSRYLVGFDGDWNAKEGEKYEYSFNRCYNMAIDWIDKHQDK